MSKSIFHDFIALQLQPRVHTKTRPNWHPKPLLFTPRGNTLYKAYIYLLDQYKVNGYAIWPNTDLLKTSPHQRMHSKNGISARGQSSLYVTCGTVAVYHQTESPVFQNFHCAQFCAKS